jgi:chromosome segregation ATPase
MSKVKTIQDYETESETMTIKKSQLDTQMKTMHTRLHELNSDVVKKGGEAKKEKEKLQICFENYNKMKAERDTIKQQLKNMTEQIEKMKNSHKPIDKIKGFEIMMNNNDIEKNIDKYYNDHCKKEVDDFRKMFEE